MRVLVIGGAGHVAGLILPALGDHHELRVLDRRPPADPGLDHVVGDATDPAAVARAADGVDALVHCAMARHGTGAEAFDVNVKSVYVAMHAGVPHAVQISSLSVFAGLYRRRVDEDTVPDATDLYGLTKRLGEEVCRAAAAETGISVNVLRLAHPTPDGAWPRWVGPTGRVRQIRARDRARTPLAALAGTDLARAVLAALAYRAGFQIFTIAGTEVLWSTAKARTVLGWSHR